MYIPDFKSSESEHPSCDSSAVSLNHAGIESFKTKHAIVIEPLIVKRKETGCFSLYCPLQLHFSTLAESHPDDGTSVCTVLCRESPHQTQLKQRRNNHSCCCSASPHLYQVKGALFSKQGHIASLRNQIWYSYLGTHVKVLAIPLGTWGFQSSLGVKSYSFFFKIMPI